MHTIPRIDYKKITDAITHYTSFGFIEIEVPWIIGKDAYLATKPPLSLDFYTLGGYLNASGEQSFIQRMIQGEVLAKHICITPCFREEHILDDIHHRYFIKAELIDTNVTEENLHAMINTAKSFFEKYLEVKVIQTDEAGNAFDIVDTKNNTELGSYGIRQYKNFSWIYGTGVALPRLDTVINK